MKSAKIRIFIVDDHELMRRGVREMFECEKDCEICGEACDGAEAVRMVGALRPHFVIMDLSMKNMNGLDATRAICRADAEVRVIVLSTDYSDQIVGEAITAGARGYVLKSDAGRTLVAAVRAVLAGEQFFSAEVGAAAHRAGARLQRTGESSSRATSDLTHRERQVVQLLTEGATNGVAAESLGISIKTLETHRAKIMRKLKLKSFAKLVHYAIRNHIIKPS